MSRLTSRSIVLLTLSLACVSALSQPAKAAAPQIASIGNTAAPLSASSPTLPPDIADARIIGKPYRQEAVARAAAEVLAAR